MSDRPNNIPLLIALVLAVMVHLLLARPLRGWMIGSPIGDAVKPTVEKIDSPKDTEKPEEKDPAKPRPQPQPQPKPKPKPDEPKVGQLDPSTATTMRLVTWDDAMKLMARQSQVEEPAIQKQTEPDKSAQQTPVDPTPPAVARINTTDPIHPAASKPVQAARPQPQQLQQPPQPQQPSQPVAQQMTLPRLPQITPPDEAQPQKPQPQQVPPQPPIADATDPQKQPPTESQKPQVTPGSQRPQSIDILALDSNQPSLPVRISPSPSQTPQSAPGLIDKPFDKPDPQSTKTELVPKPIPPSPRQVPNPQTPADQPLPKPDQPTPKTDQPTPKPTQPQQPQPAQQPSPAAQQQPATLQQKTPKPNPTVAANSDFESDPVSEIDSAEIHPGGVVSVQGVSVKTTMPRYSVVARLTAVPRNPVFRVHFNARGIVDNVEKIQSSGYDNVDGPIVTALWKWKAEGKIAPEGLTIRRLHILLGVVKESDNPADSDDTDE